MSLLFLLLLLLFAVYVGAASTRWSDIADSLSRHAKKHAMYVMHSPNGNLLRSAKPVSDISMPGGNILPPVNLQCTAITPDQINVVEATRSYSYSFSRLLTFDWLQSYKMRIHTFEY